MGIYSCAAGCGRRISVSLIRGGNPVARADPEAYATDYLVCKRCDAHYCDRCAPETCLECGEKLVAGDGRAEAERRLLEPMMDQMRRAAERLAMELAGLELAEAVRLAEPGTESLIHELALLHGEELGQILEAAGEPRPATLCSRTAHDQLWRAYLATRFVEGLPREALGVLEIDAIKLHYVLELHAGRTSVVDRSGPFPGLSTALLRRSPELELALNYCEVEALHSLELDPEATPAPLSEHLALITRTGFTIGVAEGVARAGVMCASQHPERVPWLSVMAFVWMVDVVLASPALYPLSELFRDVLTEARRHPDRRVRDEARRACRRLEQLGG